MTRYTSSSLILKLSLVSVIPNFIFVKDIRLLLFEKFLVPRQVFLELVLNHAHDEGANLEVSYDAVELTEAGETEEDVDDVGGEFDAVFPFFTQDSGQRSKHSF